MADKSIGPNLFPICLKTSEYAVSPPNQNLLPFEPITSQLPHKALLWSVRPLREKWFAGVKIILAASRKRKIEFGYHTPVLLDTVLLRTRDSKKNETWEDFGCKFWLQIYPTILNLGMVYQTYLIFIQIWLKISKTFIK